MRILLTNDDGIHAPGLQCLEQIAKEVGDEIWIVAPEADQSGFAHSLSLSEPLRLRKIGDRRFAVRGTPTDCVIMAVRHIMPDPPDLILSGVNSGTNVADDVTYSGTVAGAMEGTMLGIRSMALSQAYRMGGSGAERELPWETAQAHGAQLIRKALKADLPAGVFVNINFPSCAPSEVTGTVVAVQGKLSYGMSVEQRMDGRGFPYYWLRFGRERLEPTSGTDLHAIDHRQISVTPLQLDLTAHEVLDSLAKAIA